MFPSLKTTNMAAESEPNFEVEGMVLFPKKEDPSTLEGLGWGRFRNQQSEPITGSRSIDLGGNWKRSTWETSADKAKREAREKNAAAAVAKAKVRGNGRNN